MSLCVSDLLNLMKERGADDNAKLFSKLAGGFLYSPHPVEYACVAIRETEVLSCRIFPDTTEKDKKQKIVEIVEAFPEFDYYNCLTVRELREFLERVEDKSILIGVVSPDKIEKGYIADVVNAKPTSNKPFYPDIKLRELFGNNIFHLLI